MSTHPDLAPATDADTTAPAHEATPLDLAAEAETPAAAALPRSKPKAVAMTSLVVLLAMSGSFALGVIFAEDVKSLSDLARGVKKDEWGGAGGSGDDAGNGREGKDAAVLVATEAITRGDMLEMYEQNAHLGAESMVTLLAEVGGRVAKVLVEEGHWVQAGQPMAELDPRQLRLLRDQAQLALGEAQNRVQSALVLFEEAEQDYRAQLDLATGRTDVISATVLQQKKTRRDTTEIDYQNALSARDRSASAFEQAKIDLGHTVLTAPIAGLVAERAVTEGQQIGSREKVFALVDPRSLQIELRVAERMLARLREGATASVAPYDARELRFPGVIVSISPVVDVTQGTTAKVVVRSQALSDFASKSGRPAQPGQATAVRVGQFMVVALELSRRPDALRVPKKARLFDHRQPYCFLARDGKALRVDLSDAQGIEDDEFIEYQGDLIRAGDHIVVEGQAHLKPDSKVRDVAEEVPLKKGAATAEGARAQRPHPRPRAGQ